MYAVFLMSELLFGLSRHNNARQGRSGGGCEGTQRVVVRSLFALGGGWFLLGNAWVWGSWSCWEQWPSGYLSAVALVLAYYGAILGCLLLARKSVDRSCYMVL